MKQRVRMFHKCKTFIIMLSFCAVILAMVALPILIYNWYVWDWSNKPEQLDGFSYSVRARMEEFGVTLPESAEFVSGEQYSFLQAQWFRIVFYLEAGANPADMLNESWTQRADWAVENTKQEASEVADKLGVEGVFSYGFSDEKKGSRLYYSEPMEGKICVIFEWIKR